MRQDILKFGLVGIINTGIDFLLLNLFTRLGLELFWAIFFAYLLGAVNGYVLNSRWTYRKMGTPNLKGYLTYTTISFIGLLLTEVVIFLLSHYLELGLNLDKLIAVIIVFSWNFISNRLLTFRY